ncbi:hypothetical protein DdX_14957 [Ditylenchus destructor]|uniref:Uncharacterized protein n=1 Tax=Ditylenchus destructor TaxID=166010 RepID=A0AAD4MR18_9BILA|nr:hypothetical protein DdX_14957 [Ditylenchus destructor]
MDFEELLAQAGSNAKKLNKKVKEADREMKHEERKKMERLAVQRKIEKEELKRKAPPKPQPPPKPKFVIPKKDQTKAEVDKEQLQRFLNRHDQAKRQMELQKKQEKEELIRLRMEAMGGKANKKIAKHFGKSPIELQMRYGRDSEQLDRLIKDKEREDTDGSSITIIDDSMERTATVSEQSQIETYKRRMRNYNAIHHPAAPRGFTQIYGGGLPFDTETSSAPIPPCFCAYCRVVVVEDY